MQDPDLMTCFGTDIARGMRRSGFGKIILASLVLVAASGCAHPGKTKPPADNLLLHEWSGPFGGVPAFDKMTVADVRPALEYGMAEHLKEIDRITASTASPTFENTIAALEDTGRTLDRVMTYYSLMSGSLSTPEFRAVERQMAPRISAHRSRITQNEELFKRIRAVYEGDEFKMLRPDQQRLVWLVYRDFARNGATLSGEARRRYVEIRKRLAVLYTQFSSNLLADEEKYVLYLGPDQLDGLPEAFVRAAANRAAANGYPGKYAITNTRSSMDPFLTFSTHRDLREQVWRTYYNRGDNGDANDNNDVIEEILELREERVRLLGYSNYATWQLEDRMAKTPARVFDLLNKIWRPALDRVHQEVHDMQALADSENAGITIAPWDYRYYAEKVRTKRFSFDSDTLTQYLAMNNLLAAMFYVADEDFGLEFSELSRGTVPVFQPTVRVWAVTRKSTGENVGLWYFDPYARPGKESGAWSDTFRDHESFRGDVLTLSSNNTNFIEPEPGTSALLSWDDAETMFHEFGHALNSLESNVAYPGLSRGVRDSTEFQSQLLERWLLSDQVMQKFLLNDKTGEPMPAELKEKLLQSRTFNQGFETVEYLACALMDMFYHTTEAEGIVPDRFEREKLASIHMPSEIPMRHRSTQFSHIFSGEGYAAGYYSYIWAEVLTADAAEAFEEAPGGYFDKNLAAKLVEYLFAPHNSMDPLEAYRAFRGHDAQVDALLRARGFPVTKE